jgi:hypothetical protein
MIKVSRIVELLRLRKVFLTVSAKSYTIMPVLPMACLMMAADLFTIWAFLRYVD